MPVTTSRGQAAGNNPTVGHDNCNVCPAIWSWPVFKIFLVPLCPGWAEFLQARNWKKDLTEDIWKWCWQMLIRSISIFCILDCQDLTRHRRWIRTFCAPAAVLLVLCDIEMQLMASWQCVLLDVGWVGSAREEQVGLPLQSASIKPIGLFFFLNLLVFRGWIYKSLKMLAWICLNMYEHDMIWHVSPCHTEKKRPF